MKRVLFVGFDPATVDYSDPAIPPGMTAERIHAGIKITLADMAKRGWDAELCLIRPDETAVAAVEGRLAAQRCDCVVIGAGRRRPLLSTRVRKTALRQPSDGSRTDDQGAPVKRVAGEAAQPQSRRTCSAAAPRRSSQHSLSRATARMSVAWQRGQRRMLPIGRP